MKRLIIVYVFLVVLFFATGCTDNIENAGTKSNVNSTENSLVSSTTVTNNDRNNKSANNGAAYIVKIGDKFYVNDRLVKGSTFVSSIYEIADNETRKIYKDTDLYEDSFNGAHSLFCLDYILDGRILQSADSDTYLDIETGTLKKSSKRYSPGAGDYYGFIDNNERYFYDTQKLYKYEDGKHYQIIDAKNVGDEWLSFSPGTIYISGPYLYYQNLSGNKCYICKYDIKSGKTVKEYPVAESEDNASAMNIICEDNRNLFYNINEYDKKKKESYNCLYHIDLETSKKNQVYKTKGSMCANLFEDSIYISVSDNKNDGGLYRIDYKNGYKAEKLYSGEPEGVYIFDAEQIYFPEYLESGSMVIYSLRLSDNKTELVFEGEKPERSAFDNNSETQDSNEPKLGDPL